jgi:hypothetical protein
LILSREIPDLPDLPDAFLRLILWKIIVSLANVSTTTSDIDGFTLD